MRASTRFPTLSCDSQIRSASRSLLTLGAALSLVLVSACVTPTQVVPDDPDPVSQPVAAPSTVSTPRPAPMVQIIEIHQADLHGQIESKQGSTITIRALLMMTKTQPAVGNKGVLFISPPGAQSDTEWVPLGDVVIQKPLDDSSRLQIKIADDEKKFMITGGKRPSPLTKNTRVKLRWEW